MKISCFGRFFGLLLTPIIFFLSSCSMQLEDTEGLSSRELIESLTRNVRNARVTVGIVKNGEMSFTLYGENGRILPSREYVYDIASITKAITGQLFAKAIYENLITLADLDATIDTFLDLPPRNYYPTIRRLLTHTSGYNEFFNYILPPPLSPVENPLYGVTRDMTIRHIERISLENRDYPWRYSNSGFAVAGLVLESIFNEDFTSLVNRYLRDLGLNSTRVGDGRGDLSFFWRWNAGNPHIASGGLVSTVKDLMKFAQMQIEQTPTYVELAHRVWAKDVYVPFDLPEFDRTDAMGLGWWIDRTNNIIHHGGSTGVLQTAYVGFDPDRRIAVVVLTNIRRNIPAWVIGTQIFKELQ